MARGVYITVTLLGIMTATVSSQVVRPAGTVRTPSTATSVLPKGEALIKGTVLDMNSAPVPNAPVRLRNLLSNKVEQSSVANQAGEFMFIARPQVPYVVEISDQSGRIVAVSDIIAAQVGDVAGAMVTVPTRLPALAGLFGESLGSVISAAAGTGITAINPETLPEVSPER